MMKGYWIIKHDMPGHIVCSECGGNDCHMRSPCVWCGMEMESIIETTNKKKAKQNKRKVLWR